VFTGSGLRRVCLRGSGKKSTCRTVTRIKGFVKGFLVLFDGFWCVLKSG